MISLDITGWDALQTRVKHLADDAWDPNAHAAAATVVGAVWAQVLTGAAAPPLTRAIHRPDLVETIQVGSEPAAGVVRGETADLVTGKPAWDMKPGLLHGPKSRPLRRGGRYNIIPMRHDPETVPTPVVLDLVMHGVAADEVGPRRQKYTPVGAYLWKTGLYSRMRIGGGAGHPSGPVTFRTVSTRSPAASWWYPARPGVPLLEAIWQAAAPAVRAIYLARWGAAP